MTTPLSQNLQAEAARIHLKGLRLRPDLFLDEVELDGGPIAWQPTAGGGDPGRIEAGETRFRVMMTEPHINELLTANLPAETPLRNLRVAFLSGKARISGQVVKIIAVPFATEATVRIDNGVNISLDLKSGNVGAMGLPAALVELIEQHVNKSLALDLTRLPFPVWLDEALCEPGRLTIRGKAKLSRPPAALPPAVAPFSLG